MKQKYLLSMLIGGALLTACSMDDDLNTALTKDGVNPSAPVFTIQSGNTLTRSHWVDRDLENKKGGKVGYDNDDKLSLYHGISDVTNLSKYGNAIYNGKEEGDAFKLTTQAMVEEGYAIMVWPSDTTFKKRTTTGPVITVEAEQTKEGKTTELLPNMTDFLNIGEYEDWEENNTSSAGFARNYDIVLKPAASLLALQMEIDMSKVDLSGLDEVEEGVHIDKVELKSDKQSFTTQISIKAGDLITDNGEKIAHPAWEYMSTLDTDNEYEQNKYTDAITTNIIKNQKTDASNVVDTAHFVLLPFNEQFGDGSSLIVHTNYGDVTIESKVENAQGAMVDNPIWENPIYDAEDAEKGPEYYTVAGGLNFLKDYVYKNYTTANFKNEPMGTYLTSKVKVDLSDLKMDGKHVEDAKALRVLLQVYGKICPNSDVTFILDGKNDKKFIMDKKTWEMVEDCLGKYENLKLTICDEEAPCEAIVLDNSGENAEREEVPALRFVESVNEGNVANVELIGNWKYADVVNNPETTDAKGKTFDGVAQLIVTKDANLDLQNYIAAKTELENGLEIVVKGTANVKGQVNLQVDMTNEGTIEIESGNNRLAVNDKVTLVNKATTNSTAERWWDTNEGAGVINNAGTLAILDQTNGEIWNFGVINVMNANARTLITSNASEGAKISDSFKDGNQIGTINLLDANAGYNKLTIQKVTKTDKTAEGFIKIKASLNSTLDVANYIILDQGTFKKNENIKYLEVKNDDKDNPTGIEIDFDDVASLKGLIVNKNNSIFIPKDKTVSIDATDGCVYVKGTITRAGTFTYRMGTDDKTTQLKGYFGGEFNDKVNIFSEGAVD